MSRLLQYLPWHLIRQLVRGLRPKPRRSRHSVEDVLDALWVSHIHQLAEYRRTVWGWT